MADSLWVGEAAVLDAGYLASLWFVGELPWPSCFVIGALITGFVAGKRVCLGRAKADPALVSVAPVLPFSLWNLSRHCPKPQAPATAEIARETGTSVSGEPLRVVVNRIGFPRGSLA